MRVYDGFVKIELVTLPDGSTREIVERGDSAAVLLHDPARSVVVLVRQPRPAVARHVDGPLVEIVAGAIDAGETPENAARREAVEETGYSINAMRFLGEMLPSPGASSEKISLYLGEISEENRPGAGGGIGDEGVEIVEIAVEDIPLHPFLDGKTRLAILLSGLA